MDPRSSFLTRWRIAFCRAYHDDYGALLTRMDNEIVKHKRRADAAHHMNRYFIEAAQKNYSAKRAAKKRADANLAWAVFFLGLLLIEAGRVALSNL